MSAVSFFALSLLPFGWRIGFCLCNAHSDLQKGRSHKQFEGDPLAFLLGKNSRVVFILELLVHSVVQVILVKTL